MRRLLTIVGVPDTVGGPVPRGRDLPGEPGVSATDVTRFLAE